MFLQALFAQKATMPDNSSKGDNNNTISNNHVMTTNNTPAPPTAPTATNKRVVTYCVLFLSITMMLSMLVFNTTNAGNKTTQSRARVGRKVIAEEGVLPSSSSSSKRVVSTNAWKQKEIADEAEEEKYFDDNVSITSDTTQRQQQQQQQKQKKKKRERDRFDEQNHVEFKKINEKAKKCSLIVASFYATKPGGFDRKKGERCNGCHEPPVFITFESARIANKNAQNVCVAILTDEETEIDLSKPGMDFVQIHRFAGLLDRTKIGTGALMLERMKLYNAFIKRARDNDYMADLLMVDTDIVFIGDVSDLFKTRNFDYGVTIRDNKAYPVQGGVQFVPRGKYVGAAKFSDHTLDMWKEDLAKTGKEAGFTGDQAAYQRGLNVPASKIQQLARGKKTVDLPVVCGHTDAEAVTVRMIPGEQYNFVPTGNGQSLKKKDIRVLHYKGGKKEGMFVPYNAMKKSRDVADVFNLKKLVV
jgi:hypothetical protein